MNKGKFNQKAGPVLSIFVMSSCVVIVILLYTMQKSVELKENLLIRGDYSAYLE